MKFKDYFDKVKKLYQTDSYFKSDMPNADYYPITVNPELGELIDHIDPIEYSTIVGKNLEDIADSRVELCKGLGYGLTVLKFGNSRMPGVTLFSFISDNDVGVCAPQCADETIDGNIYSHELVPVKVKVSITLDCIDELAKLIGNKEIRVPSNFSFRNRK